MPGSELKVVSMRTAKECLAKAADMDRQAGLCITPEMTAEFVAMAKRWRDVASQARWQDEPRFRR